MPGGEYEYVDLGEKRVIPGLIDCQDVVILGRLRQEEFVCTGSHLSKELAEVIKKRRLKKKKKASDSGLGI